MSMQTHLAAESWPEMSPEEYSGLRDSIRDHGLRDPVLLWRGQLLDGRHRARACAEVGVELRFNDVSDLEEADAVQHALDVNAHRRSCTQRQKADAVAKNGPLVDRLRKAARAAILAGAENDSPSTEGFSHLTKAFRPDRKSARTDVELARIAGVSQSTMQRALRDAGKTRPRREKSDHDDPFGSDDQPEEAADPTSEEQNIKPGRYTEEERAAVAERRAKVVELRSAGMRAKQVADELGVDVHTVACDSRAMNFDAAGNRAAEKFVNFCIELRASAEALLVTVPGLDENQRKSVGRELKRARKTLGEIIHKVYGENT